MKLNSIEGSILMVLTFTTSFLFGSLVYFPQDKALRAVKEHVINTNLVSAAKDVEGNEVLIWGDNCTLDDKYAQERVSFEGKTVWVLKK